MTDICIPVIDKTTAPLVGPDFTLIHEGTNAVAQPLDFGSSTRQSVLSFAKIDKNDIISKLIVLSLIKSIKLKNYSLQQNGKQIITAV